MNLIDLGSKVPVEYGATFSNCCGAEFMPPDKDLFEYGRGLVVSINNITPVQDNGKFKIDHVKLSDGNVLVIGTRYDL